MKLFRVCHVTMYMSKILILKMRVLGVGIWKNKYGKGKEDLVLLDLNWQYQYELISMNL